MSNTSKKEMDKVMTKREAAEFWVHRDINAIPQSIIQKAYLDSENCDGIVEITPPSEGDRVYYYTGSISGEIEAYDEESEMYKLRLDNGEEAEADADKLEVERYDFLPMWGTMFMLSDFTDEEWLRGNLQAVANCGFRIYEIEEGLLLGIDGAGYDFYESHWIPLYDARGLKWHDKEPKGKCDLLLAT